jgi:hypothetical protein
MMKPHRRQRPAILDYALILGAWLLMFAYLTSGGPSAALALDLAELGKLRVEIGELPAARPGRSGEVNHIDSIVCAEKLTRRAALSKRCPRSVHVSDRTGTIAKRK